MALAECAEWGLNTEEKGSIVSKKVRFCLLSPGEKAHKGWSLKQRNSEDFKTLTTPSAGKDVELQELLFIADGDAKMIQPLLKAICQFLKKLKVGLSYNPEIVLLGIYTIIYVHTKPAHGCL